MDERMDGQIDKQTDRLRHLGRVAPRGSAASGSGGKPERKPRRPGGRGGGDGGGGGAAETASVGSLVRGAAASHLARGLACLAELERSSGSGGGSVEAVHQLRVEFRRAGLCVGLWEDLSAPAVSGGVPLPLAAPGEAVNDARSAGSTADLRRAASRALKLWAPVRDADVLLAQLEEADVASGRGRSGEEAAVLTEVFADFDRERLRAERKALKRSFLLEKPLKKEKTKRKKKKKKKGAQEEKVFPLGKSGGYLAGLGGALVGRKAWRKTVNRQGKRQIAGRLTWMMGVRLQ